MKHKSVYLLCFFALFCFLTSVSAYAVSNPVGEPSHAVKPKLKSMIYHIIVQYIVKKATGIRLVKKKFHDKLIMCQIFSFYD